MIGRYCVPRMIVARPLAVPIPRPLMAFGPTRLNLRVGEDGIERKVTLSQTNTHQKAGLTWEHFVACLVQ